MWYKYCTTYYSVVPLVLNHLNPETESKLSGEPDRYHYSSNGSGADIKTIVKFPIIHDVTGLTVDYIDEKLYWTDFLGSAAVVSSSTYDGSHIITHFHRTGAVSIARNTIFFTENVFSGFLGCCLVRSLLVHF